MLDKAELKEELLPKGNLWKTQRTSIRQHNLPEELIRTNAMSLDIHIVSFHYHLKLSIFYLHRGIIKSNISGVQLSQIKLSIINLIFAMEKDKINLYKIDSKELFNT